MSQVTTNPREFLWTEKYRPTSIDETILPNAIKDQFKSLIAGGRIPNLLLSGSAGCGKTTIAKALCNEIGADWIIINGSSENSIDTLRNKITQFASTVSFTESKKVTIIDESDHLPQIHIQPALRNFIEEFSSNHTFIFTCNYKNRIIEPLHSRFQDVTFKIPKTEQPALAAQFFKRVTQILDLEKIEYDKRVVADLVNRFFPDFRKCLNELQKYSATGKIDVGILSNFSEESFSLLVKALKDKKFNDVRKWVSQNSDVDSVTFFRSFYDSASEKLEPKSIPELILTLSEYQKSAAIVADQEINMAAFLTQILLNNLSWK